MFSMLRAVAMMSAAIVAVGVTVIVAHAPHEAVAADRDNSRAVPPSVVLPGPARPGPLCEIGGGPLTPDKNDFTNVLFHNKGTLWFRALAPLRGVNLRIKGGNACTCMSCPNGSSYATGLKAAGAFDKNEKRSYFVDCSIAFSFIPLGPYWGGADIDYFVQTHPSGAGAFYTAKCKGTFKISN